MLFGLINSLKAQSSYSVQGKIVDTATNRNMKDASVIVLRAKDSIIVSYGRAFDGGYFFFSHLFSGNFLLLVSYPGYVDRLESFQISVGGSVANLGNLKMVRKSILLQEILIKGVQSKININGDTTIFNARRFAIQPNASVEDLLKKFPGIQIDKNGKIMAHGELVTKVLVDGEEFFGDDPTLVTKNIRADMVDKVQLYDKSSDQASLTGIEDGQKVKTLNVQLRADKKIGFFGKVDAGIATNKYYQEQILFNKFHDKQKIAIFGTLANTGKIGLNWQDGQKYGTTNSIQVGENGDMRIDGGTDELETFNGRYNGKGIPTAAASGFHYGDKWDNGKYTLNTNYKLASLEVEGSSLSKTQQNIPSYLVTTNTDRNYQNHISRHKLDVTYDILLDTSSTLKIFIDGSLKNINSKNSYRSSITDGNKNPLNTSGRKLDNMSRQKNFHASLFYSKKFAMKGRALSIVWGETNTHNNSVGYLNSDIHLSNTQTHLDTAIVINQFKKNVLSNNLVNSNIAYTEPFSKSISLTVVYGLAVAKNSADKKSFDLSSSGKYNLLSDSLNSYYKLRRISNQVGTFLMYHQEKTTMSLGARVFNIRYQQSDRLALSTLNRDFRCFAPQAIFKYQVDKLASISIKYDGHNNLPTLDQIQPVKSNTDPLNVIVGNPNLTPSFTNSLDLNYNSYKITTQQSIYVSGSYQITSNAIVNKIYYNYLAGKAIYQASNVSQKKPTSFNLNVNFRRKIEKLDLNLGFNLYAYRSVYFGFSNDVLSQTISSSYIAQATISKSSDDKFDVYLNAGPGFIISKSSFQEANNDGKSFNADGGVTIYLPAKCQLNFDAQYTYLARTDVFNQPFHQFLFNASVSKKFFKKQNVQLLLSGDDLLNKNIGFNREASYDVIQETQESTIKRYIKCSIIWNFINDESKATKAKM